MTSCERARRLVCEASWRKRGASGTDWRTSSSSPTEGTAWKHLASRTQLRGTVHPLYTHKHTKSSHKKDFSVNINVGLSFIFWPLWVWFWHLWCKVMQYDYFSTYYSISLWFLCLLMKRYSDMQEAAAWRRVRWDLKKKKITCHVAPHFPPRIDITWPHMTVFN